VNRDPRDALFWVLPLSLGLMLGLFGVPEAHAAQWAPFGSEPAAPVDRGWLAMLGLASVVFIARGRMRFAVESKRLELAQRLIERGLEPPRELLAAPLSNDHRRGIVLLFAGLGVFAAGMFMGDRGVTAAALIPEFIGAGYLLSDRLARLTRPE